MRDGHDFRLHLLARLIRAAGGASLGLGVACGARTPLDELAPSTDGGGSADGGADAGSDVILAVDAPPDVPDVGPICVVDAASVVDAGDDAGIHTRCFTPEGSCATAKQVEDGVYFSQMCNQPRILAVLCGPTVIGSKCCYEVDQSGPIIGCYVGRAFLVDEGLVKAELGQGAGWRAGGAPSVADLGDATREALAKGWVLDGLFEHASVASFARFSMQMLAAGAPADLVRDAHAAASDEVRHAELCFALASAYAGTALKPERLPMPPALAIESDLAVMVVESVVEGCIGETLAAAQAEESLARATDPAVVAALESTLEDEIRHAELAWRFVRWAIDAGGERVRAAVAHAFASFRAPDPPLQSYAGVDLAAFAAHGRLTATDARAVALRAITEVVQPCACALLAPREPPYIVPQNTGTTAL
jgi:hypothetical protein